MNYSDIKYVDVINGEGLRVSLFVSGCTIHCKGCFNQSTWDFNSGRLFDDEAAQSIIDTVNREEYGYSGLSILGGEPFDNCEDLIKFVKRFRENTINKNIWIWSGYTLERILSDPMKKELLSLCDYIVAGPFIESKKDLTLKFRGSTNQIIYNIKENKYV